MDYENDFEDEYFGTAPGKIHYKHHAGKGATILFIHGLGSNIKTWGRMVKYLDDDFDIYLIDLLGHGKSDAPEVDYTVKLNRDIINSFIKNKNMGQCTLCGHSYGGWIAASCAQMNSSVKKLILEDSAGLKEFVYARIDANPEYRDKLLKEAIMLNPREHVVKSLIHADNTSDFLTQKTLSALKIPVLIIWGAKDEVVDIRYAKILKRYMPSSEFEVMHDAGHTPHYTNPKEVADLVQRFAKA